MIPDAQDRAELIRIVREAARAEILPRFRRLDAGDVAEKTSSQDLVTEADTRAEAMMTRAILETFPGATVIGEEAVSADKSLLGQIGAAEMGVILDPIDGTWNFAKGISTFGVILAVTHGGETVFGLLYDPLGDDWVWAAKGEGAWMGFPDGRQTQLRIAPPEGELSGFLGLYLFPRSHQPRLASLMPDYERVHTLRCSCHEYRTLAAGHVDFGLNGALMPWDHAAGVLVHAEAGGHAGLLDGRAYAPTLSEGRLLLGPDAGTWARLRDQFAFLEM